MTAQITPTCSDFGHLLESYALICNSTTWITMGTLTMPRRRAGDVVPSTLLTANCEAVSEGPMAGSSSFRKTEKRKNTPQLSGNRAERTWVQLRPSPASRSSANNRAHVGTESWCLQISETCRRSALWNVRPPRHREPRANEVAEMVHTWFLAQAINGLHCELQKTCSRSKRRGGEAAETVPVVFVPRR